MKKSLFFGASCGAAVAAAWQTISPELIPGGSNAAAACEAAISPPPLPATTAPPKIVPIHPPQATAVSLAELRRWLERRGAQLSAIDIRSTTELDSGRFGVFSNSTTCRLTSRGIYSKLKSVLGYDRGDVPIATFPLDATITAATITQLPRQGPILQELIENDVVDDRTVVICHLVVERLRGKESPLRPWIALLPSTFSTPLFWTEAELEWLKGTTLYKATQYVYIYVSF